MNNNILIMALLCFVITSCTTKEGSKGTPKEPEAITTNEFRTIQCPALIYRYPEDYDVERDGPRGERIKPENMPPPIETNITIRIPLQHKHLNNA